MNLGTNMMLKKNVLDWMWTKKEGKKKWKNWKEQKQKKRKPERKCPWKKPKLTPLKIMFVS